MLNSCLTQMVFPENIGKRRYECWSKEKTKANGHEVKLIAPVTGEIFDREIAGLLKHLINYHPFYPNGNMAFVLADPRMTP